MMDGAGDHFLARAAFAQDQHRVRTLRCLTDHAVETVHFRRTAIMLPKPWLDLILSATCDFRTSAEDARRLFQKQFNSCNPKGFVM